MSWKKDTPTNSSINWEKEFEREGERKIKGLLKTVRGRFSKVFLSEEKKE